MNGIMASHKEGITRSHEHYLRHLLLLGQAAPLALNALIKRKESQHRQTISEMIKEPCCSTISHETVSLKPDLWNTKTLCDVICALFETELSTSEPEIIKSVHVIAEQVNDMDNYTQSAALPFEVFERKWQPLHNSLLELIKDTDSPVKFKCKKMIHSFKLEPIQVNLDLIKKLRETTDVNSHVNIVIREKVFTEIHGQVEGLENTEGQNSEVIYDRQHNRQDEVVDISDGEPPLYAMTAFTEQLRDTFAYVDKPAILTCKLNTAKATVRWRKDYTPLEETETLKFVNSQHSHWLAISDAQITDTGLYSCVCGNATTSASLKVTEKPLKIVKDLQVDMEKTECRESLDISLVCTVNLQAKRPVWTHNSKRISDNNRIFGLSLELEHKLVIRNAKLEDSGEYTVDFGEVTSSTSLTINGNLDPLLEMQLSDNLYKNWVRGSLGLKYLKMGLENVADRFIKNQHSEFLLLLSNLTMCNHCNSEKLLPLHSKNVCKNLSKCVCVQTWRRMVCPTKFCSRFYDMMIDSHRFYEPLLVNTDTQLWSSDPWSVATCYISTTGYRGKKSATEVDCAGLLSLFINNTIFQKYIGEVDINGKTDVFKKAKDARNEILHNSTYELSNGQVKDYITLFKNVLEIKDEFGESPLLAEPNVTEALSNLNKLQNHQIDISLENHMDSLREHAMLEEADTLEKAEKEKDFKIQRLEQKWGRAEQELHLLYEIRAFLKKKHFSKQQKEPFELELHIQVLNSKTEPLVEANKQIFRLMKDDVAHPYNINKSDVASVSTDLSTIVQRLLSYINNVKYFKIKDVVGSDSSVDLKIQCHSCEAIDLMLALSNGNKFQEVKFELRKYFELQDGADKPYEVVASFSLPSLCDTRKQLYERRLIQETTTDYTCDMHKGLRIVSYCSNHDQLCCDACRETDHRSCFGLPSDHQHARSLPIRERETLRRRIFIKRSDIYRVSSGKQ